MAEDLGRIEPAVVGNEGNGVKGADLDAAATSPAACGIDFWAQLVVLQKGLGRCPVTAMDMPYFSNRLLEEIVACTLTEAL